MKQADIKEESELEKTGVSVNEMLIKVLPDMRGGYIFIAGGEGFSSTIETVLVNCTLQHIVI